MSKIRDAMEKQRGKVHKTRKKGRALDAIRQFYKKGASKNHNTNIDDINNDADEQGLAEGSSESSLTIADQFGINIFDKSSCLWIELSKANIGAISTIPFEYNIFDETQNRVLFVMPTMGSRENMHGTSDKPTTFSVHTCMGMDVCDIKYSMDACCKKEMKAEIRVDDENYGTILQEPKKNDYEIYDADDNIAMKLGLHSTSGGGLCGPTKTYEWHLYFVKDMLNPVGVIARNSKKKIVAGEPLGFYFKAKILKTKHFNLKHWHKVIIVTLLIGFTVRC